MRKRMKLRSVKAWFLVFALSSSKCLQYSLLVLPQKTRDEDVIDWFGA